MALIVTPGQLARRSSLYHQLAQLTSAGIGLTAAFQQLQRHPPSADFGDAFRQINAELARGRTFSESLDACAKWFPEFDRSLLLAGEQSGRLDQSFKLLDDYYASRALAARKFLSSLMYPVLLVHMAAVIFPFVTFIQKGSAVTFLASICTVLLPLYAVAFAGVYAMQSSRGEVWRLKVEQMLKRVPVLGAARHSLAIARFSAALEALISAGVTIIEAWEQAAAASGSFALRAVVHSWRAQLAKGRTHGELVSQSDYFPSLFAGQYQTGETAGKLDGTLRRMHKYYQEDSDSKMQAVAEWTPKIAYFIVAGVIAFKVVQFWSGIYGPNSELGHILNGN